MPWHGKPLPEIRLDPNDAHLRLSLLGCTERVQTLRVGASPPNG
jgi:hypothetical protein